MTSEVNGALSPFREWAWPRMLNGCGWDVSLWYLALIVHTFKLVEGWRTRHEGKSFRDFALEKVGLRRGMKKFLSEVLPLFRRSNQSERVITDEESNQHKANNDTPSNRHKVTLVEGKRIFTILPSIGYFRWSFFSFSWMWIAFIYFFQRSVGAADPYPSVFITASQIGSDILYLYYFLRDVFKYKWSERLLRGAKARVFLIIPAVFSWVVITSLNYVMKWTNTFQKSKAFFVTYCVVQGSHFLVGVTLQLLDWSMLRRLQLQLKSHLALNIENDSESEDDSESVVRVPPRGQGPCNYVAVDIEGSYSHREGVPSDLHGNTNENQLDNSYTTGSEEESSNTGKASKFRIFVPTALAWLMHLLTGMLGILFFIDITGCDGPHHAVFGIIATAFFFLMYEGQSARATILRARIEEALEH